MSMILETGQTDGIAELTYLIGEDKTGTAAVIDLQPHVEIYLELASQRKVSITRIVETHSFRLVAAILRARSISPAVSLVKISGDIRLLASGPRTITAAITLPELQPGKLPDAGKSESGDARDGDLVCAQVIGNDAAVTFGTFKGNGISADLQIDGAMMAR